MSIYLDLFFEIVITPLGLISKITRKDPLKIKWKRNDKSYWKENLKIENNKEYFKDQL